MIEDFPVQFDNSTRTPVRALARFVSDTTLYIRPPHPTDVESNRATSRYRRRSSTLRL